MRTQVFMFVVNDKGSSWAYSSPSFGAALQPAVLRHLRELAGLPSTPKHITEVCAGVCVCVCSVTVTVKRHLRELACLPPTPKHTTEVSK